MRRHAGVLGLSACILSSPYDVPTWMPQLLMDLSAHLNDTQPIEVCVITYLSPYIAAAFQSLFYLQFPRSCCQQNLCSAEIAIICVCALPDDCEENSVKLPTDSPRQLAATQAAVHR